MQDQITFNYLDEYVVQIFNGVSSMWRVHFKPKEIIQSLLIYNVKMLFSYLKI